MKPERPGCQSRTPATPLAIENPPARQRLDYRVGTHATFLTSMKERLAAFPIRIESTSEAAEPPPLQVVDLLGVCQWLSGKQDVAQLVRNQICRTNRQLADWLDQLASSGSLAGTDVPRVTADLTAALTDALPRLQLYSRPWFASAWLTPAVTELLVAKTLDAASHAQLSRRILELDCRGLGASRDARFQYPLRALTTRDAGDPAIAFLDAWATVADVLTFYQERIANEGFLRTATERRSILELANLVGYRLRPGVSASTLLAFTLDDRYRLQIPAGTPAKTTPLPGETQQTFETTEPLDARAEWNELKPRGTLVQEITIENVSNLPLIQIAGISDNVKPNDRLLFAFGANREQRPVRVVDRVELVPDSNRTLIHLQPSSLSLGEYVRVFNDRAANYRTTVASNGAAFGLETASQLGAVLKERESKIAEGVKVVDLDEQVETHFVRLIGSGAAATTIIDGILAELEGLRADSGTGLNQALKDSADEYVTEGNAVFQLARNYRRQEELVRRVRHQILGWDFLNLDPTQLTKPQWRAAANAELSELKAILDAHDAKLVMTSDEFPYMQGAGPTRIDAGLIVTDPKEKFVSARIEIANADAQDKIKLPDMPGFTKTIHGESGTLEFTGAQYGARYQQALRTVTYHSTNAAVAVGDFAITIVLTDEKGNKVQGKRTVEVVALGSGAVQTTTGPLVYVENNDPLAVDPGLKLTSTATDITTATATISSGFAAGDVLSFENTAVISGDWQESTQTLTLTSGAQTAAAYQDALRNVKYQNTTDKPGNSRRTVTFTLGTASGDRIINVIAVDDAPTVTLSSSEVAYEAGTGATVIDGGLTIADPDSDNFEGGMVRISSGFDAAQDVLDYDRLTFAEIAGEYSASTATLTLKRRDENPIPRDRLQELLRSVTFGTRTNRPDFRPRTVEFSISDGTTSSSASLTLRVTMAAPAEAIIVTTPQPLLFSEESGKTEVDSGLVVTGDSTRLVARAEVQITPTPDGGHEQLAMPDHANGITAAYDAKSGVLRLLGDENTHTLANYQDALQTVTYENTSAYPDAAERTVTFLITLAADNKTGQAVRPIEITVPTHASNLLEKVMQKFYDQLQRVVDLYPRRGSMAGTPTQEKYRESLKRMIGYFAPLFEVETSNVDDDVLELIENFGRSFVADAAGDVVRRLSERVGHAEGVFDALERQRKAAIGGDQFFPDWDAEELGEGFSDEIEENADEVLKYAKDSTRNATPPVLGSRHDALGLIGRILEIDESLTAASPNVDAVITSVKAVLIPAVQASKQQFVIPPTPGTDTPSEALEAIRAGAKLDLLDPLPSSTGTTPLLSVQAVDVEQVVASAGLLIDHLIPALRRFCIDLRSHAQDFRERFGKHIQEIVARYRFIKRLEAEGTSATSASFKKASEILDELDKAIEKLAKTELLGKYVEFVQIALDEKDGLPETKKNVSGELRQLITTIIGELNVELAKVDREVTVEGNGVEQPDLGLSNLLQLSFLQPRLDSSGGDFERSLADLLRPEPGGGNDKTSETTDVLAQLIRSFDPTADVNVYDVWRNSQYQPDKAPRLFVMRKRVAVFGYNAQKQAVYIKDSNPAVIKLPPSGWPELHPAPDEQGGDHIFLDGEHEGVVPGGFLVMEKDASLTPEVFLVAATELRPREAYGITGKTTEVLLGEQRTWWNPVVAAESDGDGGRPGIESATENPQHKDIKLLRTTVVYAESEELELAEIDITNPIGVRNAPPPQVGVSAFREAPNQIELDNLYDDLEAGRPLIITGERRDLPGVRVSEVVSIASVRQTLRQVPKERPRTRLTLAKAHLDFEYQRDTVQIYGNVVRANHGETRREVLGHGDARQEFQKFRLKKPPLTYVSAPTASGVTSTLELRVNDARWDESQRLAQLEPNDRGYVTTTDEENTTTVITGNGVHGARLPTGLENVTAKYRSGIGTAGNVPAKQIDQLGEKPLGVQKVVNPIAATGGADREDRDQARRNVPLALMALDRLVSAQDYADFARSFAGIGKAAATLTSDGSRRVVHVTIAGPADSPIDPTSDLFQNLKQAFHRLGDPDQPVVVEVAEPVALVLDARIRVRSDFEWKNVEPAIRAALLENFSFDRRELGQDVQLNEVISVIQSVRGVDYVDVDSFGSLDGSDLDLLRKAISDKDKKEDKDIAIEKLNRFADRLGTPAAFVEIHLAHRQRDPADMSRTVLRPAQFARFAPGIRGTLTLTEITA